MHAFSVFYAKKTNIYLCHISLYLTLMARNYISTSTVNLQVNAKQASQMLDKLKKDTANLEKQFKKAEAAGDKVAMKKLRQSIKENEKLMRMLTTETAQAADVLKRLDNASPKELKRTLKQLQNQLNGMQRGTEAWKKQVEQIRRVRSEIDRMNSSISQSKSFWQKCKDEIASVQNIVMGVVASITGLIAAGRKVVSEYTKMDEALTDTRKFTGMTADGVRELNQTFMEMDTRTARDKLNELAQEGGRLGKNTQESVMGYVKGADVLNVALSDLGEGATQSIAKLSNIFKIEDQYGTYNSMLKVGSVINVLSQNCTASKPYLVEFANRLAGVGAQANLSLQNIIGFGAVLDSNAQALEASATAVGQVLTRMYQEPAKYAKVAGMDVKKFTDTLNTDANQALIMFLEHLSKAKDLSVLSPMFKDMGENGARVITALSTLAKHIDEVKSQQLAANQAFDEGTSVLNEYNMFNNTAQASLDKAQKRVKEIAIELGEKLYPIMSHIYTSSGVFLRLLSQIITTLINNKNAVASLAFAIAGYTLAVTAAAIKTKALAAFHMAHATAMSIEKGVLLLLSAGYNLFAGNVTRARASMRLFNATMAANPIGLVAAALTALIPLIIKLCSHTDTYIDKANKVIENTKKISESVVKEQRELGILIGKLKGAEKGSEDYKKIKDQLISQYGRYLSGLIDEKGEIIDLAKAYDVLSQAIDRANRLRNIRTAKDELDQQYDKDQTSNINNLQAALENYGADPQTVGEIVLKVSQAVGAGKPIPTDVVKQIEDITKNGKPLHSDSGSGLNFFSRWVAQHTNIPGVKHVTSPTDYLTKINQDQKDHDKANSTLDKVELGINPTKNITSDDLLKSYYALDKIVKGNATDYASVPNYYIPDDVPTAYFGDVYEKDDKKRRHAAAVSRSAGTGKYVLLSSKTPDPQNPLTSIDFTKPGINIDIQAPDLTKRNKTSGESTVVALSPAEATTIQKHVAEELRLRGVAFGNNQQQESNNDSGTVDSYSSHVLDEKERKKREAADRKAAAEARRQAIKEKQEFKDALKQIKAQRDKDEIEAKSLRMEGEIDYRQYFELMREAEWDWFLATKQLYEKHHLEDDADYIALLEKDLDAEKKYNDQRLALDKEATERIAKMKEQEAKAKFASIRNPSMADELRLKEEILSINFNKLMDLQQMYDRGSKEWENYEMQIQDLLSADMMDKKKTLVAKAAEYQKEFDKLSVAEKYKLEREALKTLYDMKFIKEDEYRRWLDALNKKEKKERKEEKDALPGSSKNKSPKESAKSAQKKYNEEKKKLDDALAKGVIDEKEYASKLAVIKSELYEALISPLKESKSEWVSLISSMTDAWMDFANALKDPDGDLLDGLTKGLEASVAVMSAVMSQITEFTKAEMQIQTAAIEKRYDREIAFAEGNSYMTKKLEKKKQEEIAQIKEDAANKEFSMQVIMAIAQTATNALNAYGSAAAIPVVGHVLAPIAAATAVAAGLVQVAAIKKQKEAAAATGYSKGGFTRPGDVDEPAGVVHAGEWVASQKLVKSPVARPIIDMLEYAQRTNRIGSLSMEDVSRSISAPMMLAYSKQEPEMIQVAAPSPDPGSRAEFGLSQGDLASSIDRLNRRLDTPIVAVSTVAGEFGSKQAQERYDRMIRNKSRRKRS